MSAFGAFFDPVADKLVVVGALIILLFLNRVDMVVALIIIGREIAISALREWMATMGQGKSVAVAFIGKLKTVLQMVAIPMLLFSDDLFGIIDCHALGTVMISIAALLTVVSALSCARPCPLRLEVYRNPFRGSSSCRAQLAKVEVRESRHFPPN